MKFKVDGRELEAGNLRVGEVCEAEQYLKVDMEQGMGAKLAVTLFVALRRENPAKPVTVVADEVMKANFSTIEEVEESPPAEGASDGAKDHTDQPTTGPRLSEVSA